MNPSRRDFLKKVSLTAATVPFITLPTFYSKNVPIINNLDVHIFSKHLQFLDYSETGAMAAEMGFSGVDLTVRPKGHVLPDEVISILPKAIMEIENAGVKCKMITTSIESVENEDDRNIIKTAAKAGVEYYRTHWFKYSDDRSMIASLNAYQDEIRKLSIFNKLHNIIGCYQNHSGTNIGASFWEIKRILEKADPEYFGVQYDIRHATAEGGKSWKNGLRLLHPHIKVIVLKDFKWSVVGGKWKVVNTPIGEGMVDFDTYFKLLKKYNLNPPVSLHLEYPLGGAEKGKYEIMVDKKVVFDAMKNDLKTIQKLWRNA